jgi:hypothetical protein
MNIIDDLKVQYKIEDSDPILECGFVCDSVVVFALLSLLGINIDYLNYVSHLMEAIIMETMVVAFTFFIAASCTSF